MSMVPKTPTPNFPSVDHLGPRRRRRVLLAEDDEDIRSVFEMVLSEHFDISCAATGAEALHLAQSWTPDVILLDWTLPDASGEEVVRKLRAMPPDVAALPIVVVSGASTVKTLAARIGAVPCPKPCDVDQLLAAIELALTGG
jgi:DNA-binding response OmpR family regulator